MGVIQSAAQNLTGTITAIPAAAVALGVGKEYREGREIQKKLSKVENVLEEVEKAHDKKVTEETERMPEGKRREYEDEATIEILEKTKEFDEMREDLARQAFMNRPSQEKYNKYERARADTAAAYDVLEETKQWRLQRASANKKAQEAKKAKAAQSEEFRKMIMGVK